MHSVQAWLPWDLITDQHVDKMILDCDDDVSSAAFIPDCDDGGEVEDSSSGFL